MKLSKKILITIAMICFFTSLNNVSKAAQYSDLTSKHWAYNAVNEISNLGIINGYKDGTFKPSNLVTRAEFAKMVVLTLKKETDEKTNLEFVDVQDSYWGYDYIKVAANYLTAYKQGNNYYFYPSKAAVREDMAVAMVIALGLEDSEYNKNTLNRFKDKEMISENVRKYVAIAIEHDIMQGNSNGTFNPLGTLTRAEAAQLMVNAIRVEKIIINELENLEENEKERESKLVVEDKDDDLITIVYGNRLTKSSTNVDFADEGGYTSMSIRKEYVEEIYNLYLKLIDKINDDVKYQNIVTTEYKTGAVNEEENEEKFSSINFDKKIDINSKHYKLEDFYIEINTGKCWCLFTLDDYGKKEFGYYKFYTLKESELEMLNEFMPYKKDKEKQEEIQLKDLVSEDKNDEKLLLSYGDKLTQLSSYIHFMEEDNYKEEKINKNDNKKLYKLYTKLIDKLNSSVKKYNIETANFIGDSSTEFYSLDFDREIDLDSKHYRLELFNIEISTRKCWYLFTLDGHGESVFGYYTFYVLDEEELEVLKSIIPCEEAEKENKENKEKILIKFPFDSDTGYVDLGKDYQKYQYTYEDIYEVKERLSKNLPSDESLWQTPTKRKLLRTTSRSLRGKYNTFAGLYLFVRDRDTKEIIGTAYAPSINIKDFEYDSKDDTIYIGDDYLIYEYTFGDVIDTNPTTAKWYKISAPALRRARNSEVPGTNNTFDGKYVVIRYYDGGVISPEKIITTDK